jgi:nitrite reductase/ring-hydroxylating ferredoxin subunit
MDESQYRQVAHLAEIPQGNILCVELDDREILLCHTAEGVFAVDNLCTHADARLCEGRMKGSRILCPLHGAAFDVRDGSAVTRPASIPLSSYPVKLEDDWVLIAC